MEILEIGAAIASIGSFVVAIIALFNANEAKKEVRKIKQTINSKEISNSNINQIGGDNHGDIKQ